MHSKLNRNAIQTMMYIAIGLAFGSSCTNKDSSKNPVVSLESTKRLDSNRETTTKLKFTSSIRSIFHDSKGNYWFGSGKEGVSRFDGTSFIYFTVEDGLPGNQIRTIQEGEDGIIWFGTENGVGSYDGEKITEYAPGARESSQGKWSKKDSDLWFGAGTNTGVYRYDGQKLAYLAFPETNPINPDNTYLVTGFAKGGNDMIWIATYSGVFGYNGSEFITINDETVGFVGQTGVLHVRSILEDSKGILWIGNNGIGVLRIDGDTTTQFSKEMGLVPAESERSGGPSPQGTLEHVFAIQEDRHGNIWFGDRDTGVWKYDGKSMTNYSLRDGLPASSVWDIYLDRAGQLLFALDNSRVYKFNGTSFQEFPEFVGSPLLGE